MQEIDGTQLAMMAYGANEFTEIKTDVLGKLMVKLATQGISIAYNTAYGIALGMANKIPSLSNLPWPTLYHIAQIVKTATAGSRTKTSYMKKRGKKRKCVGIKKGKSGFPVKKK